MKLKVLLVEDNALFRKTLKHIIARRFEDLDIEEAANTVEAWETTRTFRPAVVFMDIRLAEGNGIRLTQRIKSEFPTTFVAMLTNLDAMEYREAAEKAGADGFISKRESTLEGIEKVLDRVLKDPPAGKGEVLHGE